jgi:hypothetical protein
MSRIKVVILVVRVPSVFLDCETEIYTGVVAFLLFGGGPCTRNHSLTPQINFAGSSAISRCPIVKYAGYEAAIERTLEVLGGSIIALGVTWVAAKFWPPRVELS